MPFMFNPLLLEAGLDLKNVHFLGMQTRRAVAPMNCGERIVTPL